MKHSLPLLALLLGTLAAPADAPKKTRHVDQGSTDKRLAGFAVPEGLTLEVVFDRAGVKNPAALAFGDDGTPYVLEEVAAKGVVKALTASKAGGPPDAARAVLAVEQPTGMLWHDGWLYLVSRGTVERHKPSKAGGKFDVSEFVAKGVGPAGLAIGPDGWLYIRAKTLSRCRPDGKKLHPYATGFRSGGGSVAFDLAGHAFTADGVRLIQASEASEFDDRRGGSLPAMLERKGSAFAGVMIYNDTQWPEAFRGRLLALDAEGRAVRSFGLAQSGATFGVDKGFDLVRAPKESAFRPRQAVVGPDGALYLVADRVYRLRETDAPLRNVQRPGKLSAESDENLLRFLSDENATVRAAAQAECVRRGDKNRKALLKLFEGNDAPILGKLASVGVLQTMYDGDVQKAFLAVLDEGDDEVRRAVAEALGLSAKRGDAVVGDGLLKALVAEDNDLRRAVAVAMARVAAPGTADNLAATLKADDGTDRVLHDGLIRALEMLGKPGIESLIRIADSGVQKDTDRVAATFLGLRIGAAFDALPRLLKNPHLSTAQRVALIESTANYRTDGPASLEAIVEAVAANPKENDEVRIAVLKALVARRAANGPKTGAFVVSQLGNNSLDVRMAALGAATELRVTASSAVLVKALAGELSPEERLATVRTLRHAGVKEKLVWEAVHRQMREESSDLKREALHALAVLEPDLAVKAAEAHLLDKDAKLQREAVAVSGLSAAGAKRVGKLWQDGKLPKTLRPAVVAALKAWAGKDAEAAKMLAALEKGDAK